MKVIVFGATGKTGQHLLRAALAQGHKVTAFGRSVERIDIDDPALAVSYTHLTLPTICSV